MLQAKLILSIPVTDCHKSLLMLVQRIWQVLMSQVAYQVGAYPGFSSMKRLGVFLRHSELDASSSQGYPQHYIGRCCSHLYT